MAANVALPDPAGVRVVRVTSALELRDAVLEAVEGADAVVMAAAVADFRPSARSGSKIKKTADEPDAIHLVKIPTFWRSWVSGAAKGSSRTLR